MALDTHRHFTEEYTFGQYAHKNTEHYQPLEK